MKIRFLKVRNWLLMGAMSLFGLTACHSNKGMAKSDINNVNERDGIDNSVATPMYGVPMGSLQMTDDVDSTISAENDVPSVNPTKTEREGMAREPQVTVYGVPTVDYCVKGRVTDANGKPIKGLQVMLVDSRIDPENLPSNNYWEVELARMSDTTDSQGNFEVKGSDRPWEEMRVLVRDIDGAKNGSFQDQLVNVSFGEPEKGDKPVSSWNLGTKKAEIAVKMNRKKK